VEASTSSCRSSESRTLKRLLIWRQPIEHYLSQRSEYLCPHGHCPSWDWRHSPFDRGLSLSLACHMPRLSILLFHNSNKERSNLKRINISTHPHVSTYQHINIALLSPAFSAMLHYTAVMSGHNAAEAKRARCPTFVVAITTSATPKVTACAARITSPSNALSSAVG